MFNREFQYDIPWLYIWLYHNCSDLCTTANWQYFWILCRFGIYLWQTYNISGYCADFSANIFGYCADFSAYIFEYCADFSAYIFEYMPISLIKILNKDRLKNIFFFEYQTKYGVFFIHKCTKFIYAQLYNAFIFQILTTLCWTEITF